MTNNSNKINQKNFNTLLNTRDNCTFARYRIKLLKV